MKARTLQAAITEAERFLDLARELQPELASGYHNRSKVSGATRRVIVSRPQYVNGGRNPVPAQAPGEARFHCFSTDHEEYENGPGHYPAAVVEWPDGKVESVPVGHIQFINEP
jgi:hypothetical protein